MIENLVLFRHGKAQRPYEAPDDFTRELVARGRDDAVLQASRLARSGFYPDIVCVSTALRAAQTWDCASQFFEGAKVKWARDLYHASADTYLDIARNSSSKNVLIIAHDPGLHELCRRFLKGSQEDLSANELHLGFPTAAIAWFAADETNRFGFELREFFTL